MIIRLLLFILVFAIGWLIYRQIKRSVGQKKSTEKVQSSEKMVKCAQCGTHLPASHATYDHQQRPFCSEEHRLKGPK